MLLSDATRESIDGTIVGEIATKRESGESGVSEGCRSITRRFGGPIDEEERCAPLGERARDGFADLPLPPRSRQQNRIAEIVSRHGTEYVYDWLRMPTNRHYRFAERLERCILRGGDRQRVGERGERARRHWRGNVKSRIAQSQSLESRRATRVHHVCVA